MLKYTPFQSSVFFFLTYPQSCVTVITLTLEHFKILPQSPTHISTHYPFFFCKPALAITNLLSVPMDLSITDISRERNH